jgi:hypothetical protein
MRFSWLAAAAVAAPVLVCGADMTARAMLDLVPSVPDTAQAAAAMWRDDNGQTKSAGQLKAFEDAMNAHVMAQSQAAMQQQMAGAPAQMAMAQKMQAAYGSPEAQAKLQAEMKNMTPAQLMAMAMSMQPQMPQAGPVSDHDQALLQQINMYPGVEEVQAQVTQAQQAQMTLDEQWKAERSAIDEKMQQEESKLPVCPGEAGEPASDKVRDVQLKYADQRIAAVAKYLAKSKANEQRMRAAVAPRVAYGDQAMAAWTKLEGPGIKQMTSGQAQAAQSTGFTDASYVASIVTDASRTAADEIAKRKRIVEMYKDIRPGCG